jgi:hypothetical protein
MRWAVLVFAVACSDETPAPEGTRVLGCHDPAVWTAEALIPTPVFPRVGGVPCQPAQYPLHRVPLEWNRLQPIKTPIEVACWRVVDASASSGWIAGQEFDLRSGDDSAVGITGFGSSLTLEARVLLRDGTLGIAIEPATFALDAAQIVDGDAAPTLAVVSHEAWVERDAVVLWGQRVETDEVLDATGLAGGATTTPFTVHRTSGGLVWRTWSRVNATPRYKEVSIGTGTRTRIAPRGKAVVVDDRLVLLHENGDTIEVREAQLAGEPLALGASTKGALLHMDGALLHYEAATGRVLTAPVGDGHFVGTQHGFPYFFDGEKFSRIVATMDKVYLELAQITVTPTEYAAIGEPLAILHDVVFGERGMLLATNRLLAGPKLASYEQLFGTGARLAAIAADGTAYTIIHGDGSAKLYRAPYVDFCE